MQHSTRTLVLTGIGVAILAGLAYVSFRNDPVSVDTATVTRDTLEVTVNADGETKVRDLYEVSAPIAGTALRSPVHAGDPVIFGETVVAIVRPASSALLDVRSRLQAEATLEEARAARHVAQADLAQAQERLKFAQAQYDRTQALVERGVTSITVLEDNQQRLSVARAEIEAAQARIDMADGTIDRAQASLVGPGDTNMENGDCCVQLKAPADGVILSVATESERPVDIGAPLVTIGDPGNLELVADILSSDAVRLTPGTRAYVERWGGPEPLIAKLDRIDPQAYTKVSALGIEEQRVDAYFTLESAPEDRPTLGDGFAVFLRIVEWRADDVLQIPLSAIFRAGDGWAVFVDDADVARRQAVDLGRRNGRMVEVKNGLSEGMKVITHPNDEISEGVRLAERSPL
jgi:HlyD family secretion protein